MGGHVVDITNAPSADLAELGAPRSGGVRMSHASAAKIKLRSALRLLEKPRAIDSEVRKAHLAVQTALEELTKEVAIRDEHDAEAAARPRLDAADLHLAPAGGQTRGLPARGTRAGAPVLGEEVILREGLRVDDRAALHGETGRAEHLLNPVPLVAGDQVADQRRDPARRVDVVGDGDVRAVDLGAGHDGSAEALMEGLRHIALTLRDLLDATDGAVEAAVTFEDGTQVTYSSDDGCHLLTSAGGTVEIPEEWIEDPGLLPAEGVESVRDQFVTRAAVASAERES